MCGCVREKIEIPRRVGGAREPDAESEEEQQQGTREGYPLPIAILHELWEAEARGSVTMMVELRP